MAQKCKIYHSLVYSRKGKTFVHTENYPKKIIALKDLRTIRREVKQGRYSDNSGNVIKNPFPRLRVVSHKCEK